MGVKGHAAGSPRVRSRWRLTFEPERGGGMRVVQIGHRDTAAVDDAVALFKMCVRSAMEAGGCRTVMVGVHVEGADCDHEVGD